MAISDRVNEIQNEFLGRRVRFLGATEAQVNWGGNDDPNKVLKKDSTYLVTDVEVHSWHTKLRLYQFDDMQFNSASFEVVENESDVPATLSKQAD